MIIFYLINSIIFLKYKLIKPDYQYNPAHIESNSS